MQDLLKSLIEDFEGAVHKWEYFFPGENDAATDCFKAIPFISRCGLTEEPLRPSAVEARQARRTIFQAAKQDAVYSECAKALLMYEGGVALMDCAKLHAEIGLGRSGNQIF